MKFPYFTAMGPEAGWYKVGPLARVQNCDSIPTPFAEHERRSSSPTAAASRCTAAWPTTGRA
jgi:coenzyme F420-reducing hydrogenase alpha subunit